MPNLYVINYKAGPSYLVLESDASEGFEMNSAEIALCYASHR